MSDPTDKISEPDRTAHAGETPAHAASPIGAPAGVEVEELTPDGGLPGEGSAHASRPDPNPDSPGGDGPRDFDDASAGADPSPAPAEAGDEEPPPQLVWYVLKVQSSREDTIRDALERRVKIQGLQRF